MKWRIDYEWGECPGTYDRAGSAMFEAFNVRGALEAWDRAGGCINSRVVCVALVKEDKGKTLKAAGRKKTCEICGREFIAACRGGKKYCSRECAKEAEKRQEDARGKRRRKTTCGVRKRDGSIVPRSRPAKTYAEIQAANRARPIVSGWRGRAVAGGGAVSVAAVKAGAK